MMRQWRISSESWQGTPEGQPLLGEPPSKLMLFAMSVLCWLMNLNGFCPRWQRASQVCLHVGMVQQSGL